MTDIKKSGLALWIRQQLSREALRALAVYMAFEGISTHIIKDLTNYRKKEVYEWSSRFREEGIDGFKNRQTNPSTNQAQKDTIPLLKPIIEQLSLINTEQEDSVVAQPLSNPKNAKPDESEILHEIINTSKAQIIPLSISQEINETDISYPAIEPEQSDVPSLIDVNESELVPDEEDTKAENVGKSIAILPDVNLMSRPSTVEKGGANWLVKEPEETNDPIEHNQVLIIQGQSDWKLIGTSIRGKLHAHYGKYREDAFTIQRYNNWHFTAIADGAGSASLARVGAHLAVNAAYQSFIDEIHLGENTDKAINLQQTLISSLKKAKQSIIEEAERRNSQPRELASTLLILAHLPQENAHLIGSAQVGDGLLVSWGNKGKILARPDQGMHAGETEFLTSVNEAELEARVHVIEFPLDEVHYLIGMTDGIADDFLPIDQNLHKIVDLLPGILSTEPEQVEAKMLALINYPKRGSSDDRTLVIFSHPFSNKANRVDDGN